MQIAETVSGVLEAVGDNSKARAVAGRVFSELRKAQREATRELRRETERLRREIQAMPPPPQPPVPPRPPRGRN